LLDLLGSQRSRRAKRSIAPTTDGRDRYGRWSWCRRSRHAIRVALMASRSRSMRSRESPRSDPFVGAAGRGAEATAISCAWARRRSDHGLSQLGNPERPKGAWQLTRPSRDHRRMQRSASRSFRATCRCKRHTRRGHLATAVIGRLETRDVAKYIPADEWSPGSRPARGERPGLACARVRTTHGDPRRTGRRSTSRSRPGCNSSSWPRTRRPRSARARPRRGRASVSRSRRSPYASASA